METAAVTLQIKRLDMETYLENYAFEYLYVDGYYIFYVSEMAYDYLRRNSNSAVSRNILDALQTNCLHIVTLK